MAPTVGPTCPLPLALQLNVLEARLRSVHPDITLQRVGVYALHLTALSLLTEMAIKGLDFPVVLVNGSVVSTDGIDVDRVVSTVACAVA